MTRDELWHAIGTIGLEKIDPLFFTTYDAYGRGLHDENELLLQLLKLLKADKDRLMKLMIRSVEIEPLAPIMICKCCTPPVQLEGSNDQR